MQYLRNTTLIIWDQGLPEEDGHYLVTVKKPDGSKVVEVRWYDEDEKSFFRLNWEEYIAFARVSESDEAFKKAKAEGMADEIEWRRDEYPDENEKFVLLFDWCGDYLAMCPFIEENRDFDGYTLDQIFAWAEIPEPCAADKTIGELMNEE